MFQTVIRRSAPIVRNVRSMSGGHGTAEASAEAARWKKVSAGMAVLSASIGVMCFVQHEHGHDINPELSYMNIRNKPFPFKYDCPLFDLKCKKKAREEAGEQ